MITSAFPLTKDESERNYAASGDDVYKDKFRRSPYLMVTGVAAISASEDYFGHDNIIDRIARLYTSSLSVECRSLRMDDVYGLIGYEVDIDTAKATYEEVPVKNNIWALNAGFGVQATFGSGKTLYAPENYVKTMYPEFVAYNHIPYRSVGDVVTSSAIHFNLNAEGVLEIGEKKRNLLLAGLDTTGESGLPFWVAFPSSNVGVRGDYTGFGFGLLSGDGQICTTSMAFQADGTSYSSYCLVKPVVVLRSDVGLNELGIR